MTFSRSLIVAAILTIFAGCGGGGSQENTTTSSSTGAASTGASVLLATGGTGTSDSGGGGGVVYIESYGSVKVLKSGTVEASFTEPAFSPTDPSNFGGIPFIVSTDTTVLLDDDPSDGNPHLYAITDDPNLYLGNGDGNTTNDPAVTGLTVEAGATLELVEPYGDGYGVLQLTNDLVIYGTVTTDLTQTSNLYIEANVIDVETGGKITVSATSDSPGPDAGEIDLGYGNGLTSQIINRGTIEAKGLGSGSGGNGGYIYFEPDDLVVNYGTIDASGGSSDTGVGGSGGELDVYVDYGNFYSSGTVLMNGGNGVSGGDSENWDVDNINGYAVYIETAYNGITYGNGDIIISGTWEANGGNSTDGNGGSGGYISLQTDAMGAVKINAAMSTKGGNGTGTSSTGGDSYGIDIYSENNDSVDPASPASISIAGQYDLRGGNGDQDGGLGGFLDIYGYGYNSSDMGSDVNLVGFPAINLNGGDGDQNGGSANDPAFGIYTYSAGINPAGPITNEADIDARGGKATGGAGSGSTGGNGASVELSTDDSNADSTTMVTNTGNIDVSGGTGDTGGDGGEITLYSASPPTLNSGTLNVEGGTGATTSGSSGNINID